MYLSASVEETILHTRYGYLRLYPGIENLEDLSYPGRQVTESGHSTN